MYDEKEKWKYITQTNQTYQVSNLGNVKGKKNNLLKPIIMKIGYSKVTLSLGNKKVFQKYIHHLVAQEFLNHDLKDKNFVVNHINGNMLDNRVDNLELVNRRENALHWAKKNRSSLAGRKRTGFCGRGHKLKQNQTHCNECRKLNKSKNTLFPINLNWKKTLIEGYLISDCGKVWSEKTNRIVKSGVNKPGYEYVNLRFKNKTKNFSISRLVYSAFKTNIPEGYVVDHVNENKLDNRIQNLRILSKKENTLASKKSMKRRNKHGFKFNETEIGEIKWLLENTKLKKKQIASIYNMSNSHISSISNGSKWSHIYSKKPKKIITNELK